MSAFSWLDPIDEENVLNDVLKMGQAKVDATADLSSRVGSIYKQAPWMSPGAILALAKGNASPQAVDALSRTSAVREYDKDPVNDKGNWFQRNVLRRAAVAWEYVGKGMELMPWYDTAKTASRWVAAVPMTAVELVQSSPRIITGQQVGNEMGDQRGRAGWFASTSLGQMFSNSDQAGSGFFIGGTAQETQARKAREYRGTINGHAFTNGRGAASLLFAPGSREYNYLSGLIDAATAIKGDPTSAIGKGVASVRTAKNLVPAADDVADIVSKLSRAEAGLTEAESIAFSNSRFGNWINNNWRAKKMVTQLTEDTDELSIIEKFDGRITIDDARRLARAGTEDEVKGIIGEAAVRLQDSIDGRIPFVEDIRQVQGTGLLSSRLPLRNWRRQGLFADAPDNYLIVNGTAEDNVKAVRNIGNYLKKLGMNPYKGGDEKARALINKALKAYSGDGTRPNFDEVRQLFTGKDGIVPMVLQNAGLTKEETRKIMGGLVTKLKKAGTYTVDEFGDVDDGGFVAQLIDSGVVSEEVLNDFVSRGVLDLEELRLQGPGALVEMLNRVQILPDAREVARIVNNPFYKFGTRFTRDKADMMVDGVEAVQNAIWKPLTLMTFGYVMRNMADSQLRIAASGLAGIGNHPIHFLQLVMGSRAVGTFNKGVKFADVTQIDEALPTFLDDVEDFQRILGSGAHTMARSNTTTMRRLVRSGHFNIVSRTQDAAMHTTGMVDSIRQIVKDPILNLYAKIRNTVEEGKQVDVLVKYLRDSPKGPKYEKSIRDYLRNGVRAVRNDGSVEYIPIGGNIDDLPLEELADLWWRITRAKAEAVIGKSDRLRFVAAYNAVPVGDQFSVTAGDKLFDVIQRWEGLDDALTGPGRTVGGGIDFMAPVKFGEGEAERFFVILERGSDEIFDAFTGETVRQPRYMVQEISKGGVLDSDIGDDVVRNLIDEEATAMRTPTIVKVADRTNVDMARGTPLSRTVERWDSAVDKFFTNFYGGKILLKFERSPVFRQYYYQVAAENAGLLSPEEAQKLLANIREYATETFKDTKRFGIRNERDMMARYVGSKDILEQIETAASKANGVGTVDQLQEYASGIAMRRTKDLLFDASKRNNLQDGLRIAAPFAAAWQEVLGTYGKLLIEDPTRIHRAQKAFTGLTKFDPDQNGDGFFYRDPQSGQYTFTFPGSGPLIKFLTGVNAPLTAPIKNVSIGLSALPAFGPAVQIAASNIIPDTPTFDDVKKVILPYGDQALTTAAVPGWMRKIASGIKGNEGQMATIYGQTYGDTLRALAASGKYDPSDQASRDQLFEDAKSAARWITVIRGVSQFVGPTAGQPEFIIPTNEGDQYASFLIKEFQKLRDNNYDTAVAEFLRIYGQDAVAYVSSKTRAIYGGLEASAEFSDWERENEGLFSKYQKTAGYLGPSDPQFDFQALNRQLQTGKRERLSPQEILADAERKAGSAKYRAARLKVGPYPTENQREWLRQYRAALHAEYPGFPLRAEFNPGEFDNTIDELRRLVRDPDTAGNNTAESIAQYLRYRDSALDKMRGAGYVSLQSKAAAPLRNWLASMAQGLIARNPEFARVYDRELAQEVED